jgi:hypothetical protein
VVLGIRRRSAKSRARLAKEELGESFEHLMQAATHVAGGVGATVGPKVSAAREYVSPATGKVRDTASHGWETTMAALAPLAAAARDGAKDGSRKARRAARKAKGKGYRAIGKKENRMSRKRWPMLAGLLAAGAAVGAAGALVRRRRKKQWQEYDPSRSLESTAGSAKSAAHRVADKVSAGAHSAAAKISGTAETAADKTSSAIDTAQQSATGQQSTGSPEEFSRTGPPSYNSRS